MGFTHDQQRARDAANFVTRYEKKPKRRTAGERLIEAAKEVAEIARGRPRRHADNAERQRRYRERKKAALPT